MMSKVRVRFAPSPTGGLHLGGVRTVLYNYLFAKKHGGDFIVRVEDTDQSRFVKGAEEYIFECLAWCGINADESVIVGGDFAPYRQSERKELYKKYAEQLVAAGQAYYAFDTPEEIETMRENRKAEGNGSLQYDAAVRMKMKNSLSLMPEETKAFLDAGKPYVIRIKVNENESVTFTDLVRGELHFENVNVDDKVLMKADGMPTYHLAVVVDDFLMKITHAFRGEEWLPSAPVHIMLWQHLFGLDNMPKWAHLPLILKPDGNGKLSKRDGDRLGFPVYAMDWTDPKTNEITKGFKELGFLPEAFLNMLAMLGWNPGSEQEIFSLDELVEAFTIERVNKGGAKFDYEKAKWYNHQWIQKLPIANYQKLVKEIFEEKGIEINNSVYFEKILNLVKGRCTLLPDFYEQASFFFRAPINWDIEAVKPKWTSEKKDFFNCFIDKIKQLETFTAETIETLFKELATEKNIKPGELQLPMRIMLVGAKFGPAVFEIAAILEKEETILRIEKALQIFEI
ncbi:MAG: glutamate--tRNA ligase [Ferruginibacter sp.]|nr:glutamate--tRNA ligase [Ferruginibacter sp.]